ncbi:MAG: AhpC/TSA family protein [Bernardetiaceae bacterium]|jgi:peroxiredoxin|nr:AhpC/TSA family protein [Bernardetiaceae bacterium]
MEYLDKLTPPSPELPFKDQVRHLVGQYLQNPAGREAVDKYNQLDQELQGRQAKQASLKTGQRLPNFTLPDHTGKPRNIYGLHAVEWLVLVYYRGQFCPFCNLELRALQAHLATIEGSPARLVAVSPQGVGSTAQTVDRNQLGYVVLSDLGAAVGRQLGLIYPVPDYLVEFHRKIGVSQEYFNASGQMELPMPATFIVDRQGLVRFDFVETNAGKRLGPERVVEFIQANREK